MFLELMIICEFFSNELQIVPAVDFKGSLRGIILLRAEKVSTAAVEVTVRK